MTSSEELPPAAYAVALASLPGMGSARLRALLDTYSPEDAWLVVSSGAAPGGRVAARWAEVARTIDPRRALDEVISAGVSVHLRSDDAFPARLRDDHEAPALLFVRGDITVLHRRRVAIVGTRRCTHYGRDVARELGRELSALGVVVVSGLALGVDGAAHEGALAADGATPAGIVGSGLNVIYPKQHSRLWQDVGDRGVLLTEAPLGAAPEPWRFPERNRIIAALAEVVVVVESRLGGGSMHTVRSAIDRDVPVMAVPGSVRSAASEGTNHLLAEGAAPVTSAADVVVALGLARPDQPPPGATPRTPEVAAHEAGVLAAVDWTPTPTEDVLRRTGLLPGEALAVLTGLEMKGLLRSGPGWWERSGTEP